MLGRAEMSREPRPAAAQAGLRWADLRLRAASALVLAPLALVAIWAGGLPWRVLLTLLAVGLAGEWAALCRTVPLRWPGIALPTLMFATALTGALASERAGIALLLGGAVLLWLLSRRVALAIGAGYIGAGLLGMLRLRAGSAGFANVLFVVVLVSAGDIGAYLAGRLIGGRKLAPAISPAKTWAGAAGGLIAASLVGSLVAAAAGAGAASLLRALALGILLAVVAQAGDLFESAIKRRFGVKDSGWIIPGHGGLLDRLDGLLAAGPAAALLALHVGRGAFLWA